MVGNHFQQMRTLICTVGDAVMDFTHLAWLQHFPYRETDPLCFSVDQQNLGWLAKVKSLIIWDFPEI